MYIISVPVVFSVKTPSSGWINLALVRQIQHEEFPANKRGYNLAKRWETSF